MRKHSVDTLDGPLLECAVFALFQCRILARGLPYSTIVLHCTPGLEERERAGERASERKREREHRRGERYTRESNALKRMLNLFNACGVTSVDAIHWVDFRKLSFKTADNYLHSTFPLSF